MLGVETVDTRGAGGHACICGLGNTEPRSVNPNQLPVAPTNAAHGLAGLGGLGVETVDTRGAGSSTCLSVRSQSAPSGPNHCRPRAGRVGGVGGGDGSTRLSVRSSNLLPVAPTIAAHGLAGLGVLGVETVTLLTGRAGGLRPRRQRLECAYGRRSPSDGAPLATLLSGCDGLKCSASPPMDPPNSAFVTVPVTVCMSNRPLCCSELLARLARRKNR